MTEYEKLRAFMGNLVSPEGKDYTTSNLNKLAEQLYRRDHAEDLDACIDRYLAGLNNVG